MSRNRVVDPYYLKRAAEKGLPTDYVPPVQYGPPVNPAEQEMKARLMQELQARFQTPSAPQEDPMARFRAAPVIEAPPTPQAYNPAGIAASVETASGPQQATVTGDPFFDVNTDFSQLARERTLKNQNDRVFTEQNRRRLASIAEQRSAADALRAANLQSQGLDETAIAQRMHPGRFAPPVDPALQQARQVDLDQRQGRVALQAMMQKFQRQGLSPAAAYIAASNSMPTSGPTNTGVPTLPGLDPMRIAATAGAGPGMAAGQYATGMERAGNELLARGQESRDRRDVGMAQAGATSQQGLLGFILDILKHQQGQQLVNQSQGNESRQQAMDWLMSDAGKAAANSPDPNQRAFYQTMQQKALQQQGAATAPAAAPLPGTSPPQAAGSDPLANQRYIATNPAAMSSYLGQFPEGEQARRRAQMMVEGGFGGDQAVADYISQTLRENDPDLASFFPDSWTHAYGDSGTPGFTTWLLGIDPLAKRGADWIQANAGIPADVALQHVRSYYNRQL